ncbi:MAG: hypothetical protein ACI8RD_003713 [Bacillariaceae sp.]|jgi:hypothetical protein
MRLTVKYAQIVSAQPTVIQKRMAISMNRSLAKDFDSFVARPSSLCFPVRRLRRLVFVETLLLLPVEENPDDDIELESPEIDSRSPEIDSRSISMMEDDAEATEDMIFDR